MPAMTIAPSSAHLVRKREPLRQRNDNGLQPLDFLGGCVSKASMTNRPLNPNKMESSLIEAPPTIATIAALEAQLRLDGYIEEELKLKDEKPKRKKKIKAGTFGTEKRSIL